jgi:8-oxo-dGTP diphosphatase
VPAAEQGSQQSQHRYQLVPRVLCFVFAGDRVLLLRGAAGKKIWPGLYNGLGGHVERSESIQAAAEREIFEEAGLRVSQLRLRGVVTIDTGAPAGIGLFVFTALAVDGALRASDEGSLEWVPLSGVRDLPVVPDVAVLLERLNAQPENAPPFSAHSKYDERDELVITFDASGVIK